VYPECLERFRQCENLFCRWNEGGRVLDRRGRLRSCVIAIDVGRLILCGFGLWVRALPFGPRQRFPSREVLAQRLCEALFLGRL
jgi:hypothetical protein